MRQPEPDYSYDRFDDYGQFMGADQYDQYKYTPDTSGPVFRDKYYIDKDYAETLDAEL